ncbi:MAG: hypothetical protein ACREQI_03560 [Candidatus Binataceae bacterium]
MAGAWLAAIIIVTALVLSRSLGGDFLLDDHPQISGNPYLGSWSFAWNSLTRSVDWYLQSTTAAQHFYRPMFNFWLTLCFHLFGLHPAGWRAAIIAVHLLVVWLVFRIASLLSADRLAALGAAALFALMPIHTQGIIWPSAASSALSTAFQLTAFEFYLRAAANGVSGSLRLRRIGISLLLLFGALMAYEAAAALPLIIAAYAFIFAQDGIDSSRTRFTNHAYAAFAAAWPYALEVGVYLVLRHRVMGSALKGVLSPRWLRSHPGLGGGPSCPRLFPNLAVVSGGACDTVGYRSSPLRY